MMKKKACAALVKQIIGAVSSMGKGKTLEALKRKTSAIKARIIIFSLLSNNKLVMITSISHKLHALFGHSNDSDHHDDHRINIIYDDHQQLEEDDDDDINQDHQYQSSSNIINTDHSKVLMSSHESHLQQPRPVHNNNIISIPTDHHHDHMTTSEDHVDLVVVDDAEKYPDPTHSLFDSDDGQFGSVIDIVKNSKQEAGQEFSLEEEIDHVADLFIRRFHRQIRIQKQLSFKRQQELIHTVD